MLALSERHLRFDTSSANSLLHVTTVPSSMCRLLCEVMHMATNLAIDPGLLNHALEVSGERTKKAAVTLALQEFIARREQAKLLDLIGELDWDETYDYKSERSRA